MKSILLKPYEHLTRRIHEIIDQTLAQPSRSQAMLPCLSELEIYREAQASVGAMQALMHEMEPSGRPNRSLE